MNTSPSSVVTDEKTRTVTIRQAEYSLQQGAFHKGYHHVVYAGTVRVKRGFTNPGCDLTVYAARVVVDREGGKIDVSGATPQPPSPAQKPQATGFASGLDGAHGADGSDGASGQDGGSITLYAGQVEGGPLELYTQGGHGARAQGGGGGADGTTPKDRDLPARPEPVQIGWDYVDTGRQTRRVPKMGYKDNDTVRQIGHWKKLGMESFLWVAKKTEHGVEGGRGGNAGLAGRPGDGGKGGNIELRTLVSLAGSLPKADTGGGQPGSIGDHGAPGKGAAGCLGAKYLYRTTAPVTIDWSTYDGDSAWDKHWNSKNSKAAWLVAVDHFDNLGVPEEFIEKSGKVKKLKLRAPQGATGKNGGYGAEGASRAPAPLKGNRGEHGKSVAQVLDTSDAELAKVPYAYLLMLQRSVTAALLERDLEEATVLLRWLMAVTAAFRAVGDDAPEDAKNRQRIHADSQHALLTMHRDDADGVMRCGWRDIGLYSAFVESSLEHVARQEAHYREYGAAGESVKERKTAIAQAVAEAEKHAEHLAGSAMTPGSIAYCREKETQIKAAITTLDAELIGYRYRLGNMPRALQEEMNAEYRKNSQLTFWDTLELVGMAAGVIINFASAASSIASMVTKVGKYYKDALQVDSWKEIFQDAIWKREFDELKGDASALMEGKEWKGLNKNSKTFLKSATDFWGKIQGYQEVLDSKKTVDEYPLDQVDVQARVLIFDTGKLELKKQRSEFETYIMTFLQEYEEAREWKHVFTDYFESCDTRFDLLAHLADVQAERREIEYQRGVVLHNLETLAAEQAKLDFDPGNYLGEDARDTLEANVHLALEQALRRVVDEARALHIWTLVEQPLPKIQKNLNAEILRSAYHEPIWEKISAKLSSTNPPARRDGSDAPFVWRREVYPKQFEELARTGKMTLALPLDPRGSEYFERLIDAKVYLRGATIGEKSEFHCVLRHPGVSEFLDEKRKVVKCYQEPRAIQLSYREVAGAGGVEPDYRYRGAIEQPFDEAGLSRIRYSPYTTWELQVTRDHSVQSKVYNRDLSLDGLQAIELRVDMFFNSFGMPRSASREAVKRPVLVPPPLA